MPKSRGRSKPSKKQRKQQSRVRLHAVPDRHDPLRDILHQLELTAGEPDALDAEVLASMFCGHGWKAGDFGADDYEPMLALVREARGRAGAGAVALARAMAGVAPTAELAAEADGAFDDLRARGAAEPKWSASLDTLRASGCWMLSDVYGDSATVLCSFDREGREHAVSFLVDFNHLGGWVKDILLTDEPERVRTMMREAAANSSATVRFGPVEPSRARRLLEDAFAATDMTWEPEVSGDFTDLRALALARLRVLPPPTPRSEPAEIEDEERQQIVTEFLASPEASQLPRDDSAEYCARLVVDYGADYDNGQILRVSPAKTEIFLLGWLPNKAVLEPEDRALMPRLMPAWIRWAGTRQGLPATAIEEVTEAAERYANDFGEAYDVENLSVGRSLLAGLPQAKGTEDLQDAVERRMFAMPYFGTRIGDDDYPRLDPNDPDERRILIEGEHPEYHEALSDPGFEAEIDGVNPRLHISMHEVVANQLWDDDPPEVWQAARRLRDADHDRHDILHTIAGLLTTHLHAAMTERHNLDLEQYRAELNQLGLETSVPGGPRTRGTARAAVYQLKISLHGAKPPIWRRLEVPADLTFAGLHRVIQAAFGWADAHLHEFEFGDHRVGVPDQDSPYAVGPPVEREDTVRIDSALQKPGDKLTYTYDFGDDWRHDILLEQLRTGVGRRHATCIAGRRAGPLEDSGGVWGYTDLCAALADLGHQRHSELSEWVRDTFGTFDFDPATFNKDGINAALAQLDLG